LPGKQRRIDVVLNIFDLSVVCVAVSAIVQARCIFTYINACRATTPAALILVFRRIHSKQRSIDAVRLYKAQLMKPRITARRRYYAVRLRDLR
jgi:hypothetical protein